MGLHPDDFPWREPPPAGGRLVHLRWLGTAGFELTCDGTVLLIDPYVTRVGLWRFLWAPLQPDEEAIAREVPSADAIVVGHSHFDHVMDVPAIARRTGARVWGSSSTANLLRGAGIPEAQVQECRGGEELEVGPFKVRLVPSEHSRFALGRRVPYAGEIPCSCELPLRGSAYRCGDVFGVLIQVGRLTLYHLGSANLIDDAVPRGDVDVFLMGISGRHATERFIPRVMKRLQPRLVVPTHYDNFFRPASRPMQLLPKTAFGRFVDEVQAFDREVPIAALRMGQTVTLAV